MLLKSGSAPIMTSWIHRQPTLEMDQGIQIRTTFKPMSMSHPSPPPPPPPSSSSSSYPISNSDKNIFRTMSDNDLKQFTKLVSDGYPQQAIIEELEKEEQGDIGENTGMETMSSLETLFSSSGLDESMMVWKNEECGAVLVGNDGGGGGVGGFCGGGGGGGDEGFENRDWGDHGNESMDGYYQRLIKADPGNAVLLGNYARFLKEVKGDVEKAEEYCGRAILAEPGDGNLLCLYGDLIWQIHKDASRAQIYFDQAVQSSPYDCYVFASYARFLWDAEEEEEEDEHEINSTNTTITSPSFIQQCSTQPSPQDGAKTIIWGLFPT